MKFNKSETESANRKLEDKIKDDRLYWKTQIEELIQKIKNISELSDCQALMLSYRQILLDKISDFKQISYKKNSTYESYYQTRYRHYTLDYDIKLSSSEKNKFIQADLAPLIYQIQLLDNHIDYYQGCIKTLDNMAFAIRNRIRLDDEQQ